ncbi:hypothetical protein STEG23_011486 [Scotinomys teguina]
MCNFSKKKTQTYTICLYDDHYEFNGSNANSIDFYSNLPNDKWVNVEGRATEQERQKETRRPDVAAKGGDTCRETSSGFSQNYKDRSSGRFLDYLSSNGPSSEYTARAFATQVALNSQLHRGIMLVNQQVDLLQEQVDVLSQVITTACIVPISGLCLMSVQYNNMTRAANLSKSISSMLTGVWMAEFDNITAQLRTEIVAINATCVPVASAEEMLTWLRSSISFLKEWAGLGALAGVLVLASIACLWCLCKIRRSQQRNAAMIIQAFTAIEAEQSPQAWLAILKD